LQRWANKVYKKKRTMGFLKDFYLVIYSESWMENICYFSKSHC
jgi:hypothetical protein